MKTVSHPRCVQLHAILDESASNGKLYVVLEYMRGGPSMEWDESECCFQARAGQITEQVAQTFVRNTLHALDYLHQKWIAHRDVKPQNLLLDGLGGLKLGDFGVATRMPDNYVVQGTEGTYHFFSPEMCASGYKGHDGRRADIWATGISLWGFLFRSLPFLHKDLPALLDTIAMGTYELPAYQICSFVPAVYLRAQSTSISNHVTAVGMVVGMKDAALEAALREALSADSIHGALRSAAARPLGADALESAVAQLHSRVLSAYQSASTTASQSHQSKEACRDQQREPDAYNVRLNFTDQDQNPLPTRTSEVVLDHQKATARLTCTHCRRPLKMDLMLSEPEASVDPERPRCAYVAVLADGKTTSFLQAWMLGLSLAKHSQGPARPERMLIHGPSVPRPFLEVLRQVWQLTAGSLGSWPSILNYPLLNSSSDRLLRLRALSLKFDKVLVLALGIVATADLDDVFDASCPAFVAEKSSAFPQQAGLPLMLLPCSHQAMRKVAIDTGHRSQNAAYPPRTIAGQKQVEGDEVLVYLKCFYRTFFQRDMLELPSELCSRLQHVAAKVWRDLDQLLRRGSSCTSAPETERLLELLGTKDRSEVSRMLASVDRERCENCKAYDFKGTLDPLDGRWRCRFCWEHMLLDSALQDPGCIPMPLHEVETLQKELEECFVPGERQRWRWKEWDRDRRWIEFRPRGVLWHSSNQVGAWEMWTDRGKRQLAINFVNFDKDGRPRPETRHLLELKDGDASARFEEYQREQFQPLGFASQGRSYKDQSKITLHPPQGFQPRRRPQEKPLGNGVPGEKKLERELHETADSVDQASLRDKEVLSTDIQVPKHASAVEMGPTPTTVVLPDVSDVSSCRSYVLNPWFVGPCLFVGGLRLPREALSASCTAFLICALAKDVAVVPELILFSDLWRLNCCKIHGSEKKVPMRSRMVLAELKRDLRAPSHVPIAAASKKVLQIPHSPQLSEVRLGALVREMCQLQPGRRCSAKEGWRCGMRHAMRSRPWRAVLIAAALIVAVSLCSPTRSCAFASGLLDREAAGGKLRRHAVPQYSKVNYELDEDGAKAAPGSQRSEDWKAKAFGAAGDDAAFDQERLLEYVWARPWEILQRLASTLSIAFGIWWAWRDRKSEAASETLLTTSLSRKGPKTASGEALRQGLQRMGVFFVKIGQTAAQRPDIVGDDVAEELKGLQEQSTPFSDELALTILAEDLQQKGPLAPGVCAKNCTDPDGEPLLMELNPRYVASASLGQVYRGRMHDGREVALKIQRPGVREVLGLDWAVATLVSRAYQKLVSSPNDYGAVVDTVARGVRMELDYYNEAANAEEFAQRHAFLPFVTSPGCIPQLMGPRESSRVLALNWYPSRSPKELPLQERRLLVEMAVEACVVQLLVTGFVHADPHEGNLRMGDDGRVVFLDFGLMDRVDFGIMESCAAGVRQVLDKNWLDLTTTFQDVRFTPKPLMKNMAYGKSKTPQYEPCGNEEFAVAVGEQIEMEAGGQSRFGAMAVALKKLSDRYLMLTPPFIALLCRTFITLEGLLGDDPALVESYNVYQKSLPFAISRLLSPRTRKGCRALRATLLDGAQASQGGATIPNWSSLSTLLTAGSQTEADAEDGLLDFADLGAEAAVQRRLLRTAEGAALRRVLFDIDIFEACRSFLTSPDAAPLRAAAIGSLAGRWSGKRKRQGKKKRRGPRSTAAARGWGDWSEDDPFRLSKTTLAHSRRAWRIILRRQLQKSCLPPWRLCWRFLLLCVQVLPVSSALLVRAALQSRSRH
ncbi:unnamed protein product [Symbiodinium necroappetens]|uniref:Protein kinase domain-containing protein n=1 Tax=Symbiodinium necroappetens TaxID=1628268 RepID=A0A813AGJ1_9DINO|nr:unnamed protein product [Symbiodinium necroappetens]